MKRVICMLAICLCWIPQLLAQDQYSYEIQFTNPCTGEIETFAASVDERNGTFYAIYTYFGQTREFNTDNPNWVTDATNWFLQVIEEQGCGMGTGVSSSVDPNVNPTMNTAINNLRNNLFTMSFDSPGAGGRASADANQDQDQEEGETSAMPKQQEIRLSGGASSYSYENYSGSASNLGLDYISLFAVGQSQVGVNLNSLSLGGNEAGGSSSTLFGFQFRKNSYGAGTANTKEQTMSFNILGGQGMDGGGSIIYNSANKVKEQDKMTNSGMAMSLSLESFNEYSTVVFNTGLAYGFMRGWYFSDKVAGSINGLLIGSFGVHNVVTENEEQNDVSLLGGATLGGAIHFFVFEGGGLKASLNYGPPSYVYTHSATYPDDLYSDSYSTSNSGFNGASSIAFNIGFSYRF